MVLNKSDSLIILNIDNDCYPNQQEAFDFSIKANRLNCNRILPLLSIHRCKNDLEGFLILEHMNISRQFRVTCILLEKIKKLKLDTVDYCLIVASQVRSLIENIAVVNFLIHDLEFTIEEKIAEITNFRNQYQAWAKSKKISTPNAKLFTEFMKVNQKFINKHIWAKISPNNNTLTKLIKSIKVPDGEYRVNGAMLFEHWDDLSKLLHNNQLFRLVYWKQDESGIHLNFDMFNDILTISLMSFTNILLRSSLHDLVVTLNDSIITEVYGNLVKEITDGFYSQKIMKL